MSRAAATNNSPLSAQAISRRELIITDKYPFPPKQGYNELDPEDFMNSGSATDCTGLIPSDPQNREEYDNYAELYDFLPPSAAEDARRYGD